MKKNKFLLLSVVISLLIGVWGSGCTKTHYPLEFGVYGFEKAFITDKVTKETIEKDTESIVNNNNDFKEWFNLFSFQIVIDENTEYFYKKDKRCFVLNEGLAFEIIGENRLQLSFPHWYGYDHNIYEILIVLGWQLVYD